MTIATRGCDARWCARSALVFCLPVLLAMPVVCALTINLPGAVLGFYEQELEALLSTIAADDGAHVQAAEREGQYGSGVRLYLRLQRYLHSKGLLPATNASQQPVGSTSDIVGTVGDFIAVSTDHFVARQAEAIPPGSRCLEVYPALYSTSLRACEELWVLAHEPNPAQWAVDSSARHIRADVSQLGPGQFALGNYFDVVIATQGWGLQQPATYAAMMRGWNGLLRAGGLLLLAVPALPHAMAAAFDKAMAGDSSGQGNEQDVSAADDGSMQVAEYGPSGCPCTDEGSCTCSAERAALAAAQRAGLWAEASLRGGDALLTSASLLGFKPGDFSHKELSRGLLYEPAAGRPESGGLHYASYFALRKARDAPVVQAPGTDAEGRGRPGQDTGDAVVPVPVNQFPAQRPEGAEQTSMGAAGEHEREPGPQRQQQQQQPPENRIEEDGGPQQHRWQRRARRRRLYAGPGLSQHLPH